jgi:putative aminopeptidase FrvX
MDDRRRTFLDDLLATRVPSGFETAGQRRWLDAVRGHADEVRTDEYGNAVAVHEGTSDLEIAVAGHGDEIGFMVRRITDDGFLRLNRIGGSDRTVTRGQHVTIHGRGGTVSGVVGQTAIHLRDREEDSVPQISEQLVDIGATGREAAEELVAVGDPVTFSSTVEDLHGTRVAARGMDNRIGIWTAAEAFRHACEVDVDPTVYAIATVQEEVGGKGAQMVGFDLDPDAVVAVDVTHATDTPDAPAKASTGVGLGSGPVVGRGGANHPVLVDAIRETAADTDTPLQVQANSNNTGTDADYFFTQRGGIPSTIVSLPNRYMHTPVEVIDTEDLTQLADLLGSFTERASEHAPFSVDLA